MNPFQQQKAAKAWHRIGLVSSIPELENHDGYRMAPKCKAFIIPKDGTSDPQAPEEADLDFSFNLANQVLVFKYQGKIHAVDHQCPHATFPLSQGKLFDIEDFGIKLSTGLTCPKHGWSFDIFTGKGDRGNYNLKLWEIDLREPSSTVEASDDDKEVWVRPKQRIG
ncbi:hypothetical protein N7504_005420 [Penicillium tannophilum]|nr:hypothetical protein N7504_005420 [Penicillium tannophilum]